MSARYSPSRNAEDDRWMQRALELARRGEALTHPNPLVGCVVVKNGWAVGESFHTYEARAHAEILALQRAGAAARNATLYVNLEPCCHTGRTGPCTTAILAAGIKRVVIAMRDPNPRVCGRGIAALARSGLRVTQGVCEAEARQLNEAFARWITTRRPFVTLKIAATLDGQIACGDGSATWLTSSQSRAEVQSMRHAADAILTGIGTVLADNPRLTDRTGQSRRKPLLRAIADSRLRFPLRSQIARSARGDVLLFTTRALASPRARALQKAGIEVIHVSGRHGHVDLRQLLQELGKREVVSLLIEGGTRINGAALAAGIVDKAVLFYAPKILGRASVPLAQANFQSLKIAPCLSNLSLRTVGPDFVVQGYLCGGV